MFVDEVGVGAEGVSDDVVVVVVVILLLLLYWGNWLGFGVIVFVVEGVKVEDVDVAVNV